MFFVPRLARALDHPLFAFVSALALVVVGVIGLVADEMKTGWAILIVVIGLLNVVRGVVSERADRVGQR